MGRSELKKHRRCFFNNLFRALQTGIALA